MCLDGGVKVISGFFLIQPAELPWRLSNLIQIPNADLLERIGSEILGVRMWRLPARSANTLRVLKTDLSLIYPKDPTQLPQELWNKIAVKPEM